MTETLNVVYIHGIGNVKQHTKKETKNFSEDFHKTLSESCKKNQIDINLNEISIIWPKKFRNIYDEYVNKYEKNEFGQKIHPTTKFISIAIVIFAYILLLLWMGMDLSILWLSLLILYLISKNWLYYFILETLYPSLDKYLIQLFWYSHLQQVRDEIKDQINSSLNHLTSQDRVLIISHSLGTVIALDYLNSLGYINLYPEIENNSKIQKADFKLDGLVTMGSPLRIYLGSIGILNSSEMLYRFPAKKTIQSGIICPI